MTRSEDPLSSGSLLFSKRQTSYLEPALLSLVVLCAVVLLIAKWWTGRSAYLGAAAYLPVSDALGYFRCAVAIATPDSLGIASGFADFCARRALYPAMLSSILAVSGNHASVALVLHACLVGVGLGVLVLALRRGMGWIPALLVFLAVMASAAFYAIGNFMTESLGLASGLAALALLILATLRRPAAPGPLVSGMALMSLAQFVRPGALLALPLLGVWAVYVTRGMPRSRRGAVLSTALAALGTGFVLQYGVVAALGADPDSTGSNSAAVLYGLSTGTREWDQAYRDFAQQFASERESVVFRQIRDAALENISQRPEVFAGSLWGAGLQFSSSLFGTGRIGMFVLTPLFWIGFVFCMRHARRPVCSLLLALALGELLTAPLVFDAGGHRIFLATLAARAAIVGIGAAWLLAAVMRMRIPSHDQVIRGHDETDRVALSASLLLAATLGLAAILPATRLLGALHGRGMPASGLCTPGQHEVVARSPQDLMQLAFGDRSIPLADERLGIAVDDLHRRSSSKREWWLQDMPALPSGSTLVHAIQRKEGDLGKLYTVFSTKPIPDLGGAYVSLCVSGRERSGVKLGDYHYAPIATWHQRGDGR